MTPVEIPDNLSSHVTGGTAITVTHKEDVHSNDSEAEGGGGGGSGGLNRRGDKIIAGLYNVGLAMIRFQNLDIHYLSVDLVRCTRAARARMLCTCSACVYAVHVLRVCMLRA